MGAGHAITGAGVWIAVTGTALPATGIMPLDPSEVIAGALICAGAALLPDADHPSATISHAFPGGSLVTGTLGALAGGHRKGMHSLIAALIVLIALPFAIRVTLPLTVWPHQLQLGALIVVCACMAFALKPLRFVSSWPAAWIVAAALAFLAQLLPGLVDILPLCVTIGYLTHLAGDMLTAGGVPLLWPVMISPPRIIAKTPIVSRIWLSHGAFAVPILGTTGSWREWLLTVAAALYVGWGVAVTAADFLPG